ncbi:hypothetical protein T439DRAFT_380910 [Meredithblackwellia eburnea MCA 4105]
MVLDKERLSSSAGPQRRGQLPPVQLDSPIQTRSGRALGSVGGKTGPGYSPYARRASSRFYPVVPNGNGHANGSADDGAQEDEDEHQLNGGVDGSPVASTSSGGLVSTIRGLPGKALGFLWRGGASKKGGNSAPPRSQSLADLAEEARLEATGAKKGRGLPRSSTAFEGLNHRASGARTHSGLPSSSTMSSLANASGGHPPPLPLRQPLPPSFGHTPRTSHSTLTLPPAPPSTAPFLSRSRHASPAMSTTSTSHRQGRSPSPTRNQLAGSISTFNLSNSNSRKAAAGLPSPTASASIFNSNGRPPSNPYGLQSRSPFAGARSPSTFSRLGSPSARSVSSSVGGGHPLFPYSSTNPRGTPSSSHNLSGPSTGSPGPNKRTYSEAGGPRASPPRFARLGSPLNPFAAGSATEERARKKQLVWDAEKGLVSREALEREAEKARAAIPVPKNEAERILEVLEGMGRTPLGEAKREASRPKISVPTPTVPAAPYAYGRREGATGQSHREGTGISAIFRAREERRQAERERERARRMEEERERFMRQMENDESRDAMEDGGEDEDDIVIEEPVRRKTRSMAKAAAAEPPTPAKGKGKGKAAAPKPVAKGKGRGRRATSEIPEATVDEDVKIASPRVKSPAASRVKSPVAKAKSPPPSKRTKSVSPPPPAPVEIPAPPPVPRVPDSRSTGSSLRPGRSHSSRQHQSSSKVFSAREEDLPPVDEGELDKIKMPMFPAGFSFGGTSASAPLAIPSSTPLAPPKPLAVPAPPSLTLFGGAEKKNDPVVEKPAGDLFSRLGPSPSATPAAPASTPFSFAPSTSSASAAPKSIFGAPPPSSAPFSFGDTASTPSASTPAASKPALAVPTDTAPSIFSASSSVAPPAPKSSLGSDFFSKPPSAPAPSLSSSTSTAPPNFFAAVLENKASTPTPPLGSPSVTPAPPSIFSGFGAAASTIKPSEVISPPPPAEVKNATAPVAANPFAAFGKPISQVAEDDGEVTKGKQEEEVPKPSPFVGSNGSIKPSERKTNGVPAPLFGATPSSTFSFGTPAASPAPVSEKPASPAPFSFGVPAAKLDGEKPASPAPFSFGAPAAKPNASSGSPASPFTFGSSSTLAAPKPIVPPVSVPVIEEPADEDSGMEDNDAPSAVAPTPSAPAFSFGGQSNGAAAASPFAFGASKPTGFGTASPSPSPAPVFGGFPAASAASPAPNMFAFNAASSASNNVFGSSSAAPSPTAASFSFGASQPMAQTQSTPSFPTSNTVSFGQSSASPSFTFGAAPTNGSTPFKFGATAPAAGGASPFGAPSGSTPFGAPAAGGGGFNFASMSGGAQSAPGSPGGGMLFNPGSGGADSPEKTTRRIAPMGGRRRKPQ